MKESALRKIAQERVRKLFREEEPEWLLKHDTPREDVVPTWQLERYRQMLQEELESYKKRQKEKTETKPQQQVIIKKAPAKKKKKGLFF